MLTCVIEKKIDHSGHEQRQLLKATQTKEKFLKSDKATLCTQLMIFQFERKITCTFSDAVLASNRHSALSKSQDKKLRL